MITRTDHHIRYRMDGTVLEDVPEVVDITAPSIEYDLHVKARNALAANAAYLALATPTNAQVAAQVKLLARENSALIRLLIGGDLLAENTDT